MASTCRRPRAGLVAALATVVLALVAGCAGGGAQPSDDPTDVSFIKATRSLGVLPLLHALDEGYFTSAGIKITELPDVTSSTASTQALLSGEADIAMAGTSAALSAQLARQDVVSVAVLSGAPSAQTVLTNDAVARLAAQGVTPESPVEEKMAALRGLTLATPGSGNTTDALFRAAVAEYGVAPDRDLRIRPIAEPSAMVAAVREGQVDGFTFSLPTTQTPVVDGFGEVWIDYAAGEVPAFDVLPYNEIITTRAFAESNPEAVDAFVTGIERAFEDILQRPEDVKAAMRDSQYFADTEQQLYERSFDAVLPAFRNGPEPTRPGFQNLVKLYNNDPSRQQKSEATFEQIYVTRFLAGGGAR